MEHRDYAVHHVSMSGIGVGFIMGAAIGVAVGMLYAPRAGAETRAMISDKADEVKEKVSEAVDMVKHKVDDVRHHGEHHVEPAV